MKTLRKTSPLMRGEDVTMYQQLVTAAGFDCGAIDGLYGNKCVLACKSFQQAHGLTVDGICGPKTRAELQEQEKPSSSAVSGEDNVRAMVVTTAKKYLGCKESDGSHHKIIDLYNSHKPLARNVKVKYTSAWCATFVSSIAIECGLTDIMPTECSCGRMIELYQKLGRWEENDAYQPKPGDVIMYDWDDNGRGDDTGWPDHVGIVTSVSGTSFKVIEGNIKNAVGYRDMKVNGKNIRGYCLPDYASKSTDSNTNTTETVNKPIAHKISRVLKLKSPYMRGNDVAWVQDTLKGLGYACGKVDGVFGMFTDDAVKVFQKDKGLTVDGDVGKETTAALGGVWAG